MLYANTSARPMTLKTASALAVCTILSRLLKAGSIAALKIANSRRYKRFNRPSRTNVFSHDDSFVFLPWRRSSSGAIYLDAWAVAYVNATSSLFYVMGQRTKGAALLEPLRAISEQASAYLASAHWCCHRNKIAA